MMTNEAKNMERDAGRAHAPVSAAEWRHVLAPYRFPSMRRAAWQVSTTLGAYGAAWALLLFVVPDFWYLAPPLIVLAGALLVRVFILFHDCTHDSLFPARRANAVVGAVTGVLTFTPFRHWRWEHARHHASAGDLDRRGTGDIWTMTVREYREATRWRRLAYRLARNPVVLFGVAPVLVFALWQRLPSKGCGRAERRSVWWTNLAILGMVGGLGWIFGFAEFLLLQLAVLVVAGAAGVWLFYVQHQFEGVSWARRAEWSFLDAALAGSSFYRLPRLLQWFSGNIGFHHLHHLDPRIPNYNLERCQRAVASFLDVQPVTLRGSLRSLRFRLWDEEAGQLVGFRQLRRGATSVAHGAPNG